MMPHVIDPAPILGCSVWSRSVMLGSADRRKPTLISHEITFEAFQPM